LNAPPPAALSILGTRPPIGRSEGYGVGRRPRGAAQRGDREAFGAIARASGARLFALAYRILRDIDRAEDATQQTLVIAWRELPRLRDPPGIL
jgi:hypothetical protein